MENFPEIIKSLARHHPTSGILSRPEGGWARFQKLLGLATGICVFTVLGCAAYLKLGGKSVDTVWYSGLLVFMILTMVVVALFLIVSAPLLFWDIRDSFKEDLKCLSERAASEGVLITELAAKFNSSSLDYAKRRLEQEILLTERHLTYIVGKFISYTVIGFVGLVIYAVILIIRNGLTLDNALVLVVSAGLGVFLVVLTERSKMNRLSHYCFIIEEAKQVPSHCRL
jgi:hypothetical protein